MNQLWSVGSKKKAKRSAVNVRRAAKKRPARGVARYEAQVARVVKRRNSKLALQDSSNLPRTHGLFHHIFETLDPRLPYLALVNFANVWLSGLLTISNINIKHVWGSNSDGA